MRCSAFCLVAGLFVLCFSPALRAAPARAIYYTELQSIVRADPISLETEVVFPNAITGSAEFEALYLDSPNGHIYWVDSKKKIHRELARVSQRRRARKLQLHRHRHRWSPGGSALGNFPLS